MVVNVRISKSILKFVNSPIKPIASIHKCHSWRIYDNVGIFVIVLKSWQFDLLVIKQIIWEIVDELWSLSEGCLTPSLCIINFLDPFDGLRRFYLSIKLINQEDIGDQLHLRISMISLGDVSNFYFSSPM